MRSGSGYRLGLHRSPHPTETDPARQYRLSSLRAMKKRTCLPSWRTFAFWIIRRTGFRSSLPPMDRPIGPPAFYRCTLPAICPVILDQSNGKACALNEAVEHATGEILVFQDARQLVDPNAISELVSCFADSAIGAVSGELLLEASSNAARLRCSGHLLEDRKNCA